MKLSPAYYSHMTSIRLQAILDYTFLLPVIIYNGIERDHFTEGGTEAESNIR